MNARGNNSQFRSVPLIQREDWLSLVDTGAAGVSRDEADEHVTDRSGLASDVRGDRSRRMREEEGMRQRARRSSDGQRRRRERTDEAPREERRRSSRTERADSRPSREHVSAYLDESTVVGVTSRSERRSSMRSSGFSLVPPATDAPESSRTRQSARRETSATFGASDRSSTYASWEAPAWDAPTWDAPAWHTPTWDTPAWDTPSRDVPASRQDTRSRRSASVSSFWDEPAPAWDGTTGWEDEAPASSFGRDVSRPSERRRRSSSSTRSMRDDGPSERTIKRDWLYTEDEHEPQGISGSSRRREALANAALAVPRAFVAGFGVLMQHARGLFVIILIALTAFMLYAPARELYVANRRLDTLQATYDALLEENESIRSDLEMLQTREGIEDEARARGYVSAGETKVIVEGLPEEDSEERITALISPLELPDTRPWYIRMLDKVFNYDPEE